MIVIILYRYGYFTIFGGVSLCFAQLGCGPLIGIFYVPVIALASLVFRNFLLVIYIYIILLNTF